MSHGLFHIRKVFLIDVTVLYAHSHSSDLLHDYLRSRAVRIFARISYGVNVELMKN